MSLKSALKAIYFCGYLLSKQLKKRPKAVVYYGTETGTSKRHAESLYELLSYKYFVQIRNISKCTLETLDQSKHKKS